jgi:ABC-type transport system involved in multi-copper enzyme maturation permease subunit
MLTNIRYILITAIRDNLFVGLLGGLFLASFIAHAMGNTAMLESEQMTLTLMAAMARMILAVGVIVFVCFHVRHAFDSKEIDVLLSRPISRANLVTSYWLGFALIAVLLVIPAYGLLIASGLLHEMGFVFWAASLLLELCLVIAIALFAAFTMRSAVFAVLASLGLYVLSRMMGFFIATAQNGILFGDAQVNATLRFIMDAIAMLIPRLDFFAKSNWLLHGLPDTSEQWLFALQTGIFVPLLLVLTIIDFKQKQF